jgi:hypothetical protein
MFYEKKETFMNEQPLSTPADVPVSSFMTRATNIFASPAELYTELAAAPVQTTTWVLPLIFSLCLAILFTVAIYNNPTLRQQIYEMQQQGMKKAVEKGQMTQEQMDRAAEAMESSGPVMFIVIGGASAAFMIAIAFFGVSLVLWLAAKFAMKFSGSYKKVLEVYGITSLIGLLGSIITLLMMNLLDSFYARPAASLFITSAFDQNNFAHNVLASLNVFSLWETAIVGIGVAKISNKPTGTGMMVVFGLWIVWTIVSSLLGWGMR